MPNKFATEIGFDFQADTFTYGTHTLDGRRRDGAKAGLEASAYNQADVDAFLAQFAKGSATSREDHILLAQTIVEPIEQVVPYVEMYSPVFFMTQNYGEIEDNRIPVEDTVAMAWETHLDGGIMYTRSGYTWTRPDFVTWATGIEVPWKGLAKAGWNYLARQMRRATEALARKRDELARNVLVAAIPASHEHLIASGGVLTKAAVDTLLKAQADIGFPVSRVLVNPGTLMDMANFDWGGTGFFIPPSEAAQLMRTLHVINYGGAEWYTNPHYLTNELLFGGTPNQIGWHQTKGEVNTASDIDIDNGVDKHAIRDAEHAWYVGNAYTLARIRIS